MVSTADWRAFLQTWSDEWFGTDERFAPGVQKGRWLGYKPATETEIQRLEKRLGYRLPPSYRAFLLTTNGWQNTSPFVERVRPAVKVEWLEFDEPALLEILESVVDSEPLDERATDEYYAYDGRAGVNPSHFRRVLKIADPIDGDSAIYVLNPAAVAEDGEWEAWLYANWIPGARRYPSFAHLMRAEYASFRSTRLGDASAPDLAGPFSGVYAPDRPRAEAIRIGPGKRRPPRLSVAELIEQLENVSTPIREKAANQLLRQCGPHDTDAEHPEWVERLSRILHAPTERVVRAAAATVLGAYGDESAIEPVLKALDDSEVVASAMHALGELSRSRKDPRISDRLCDFLATPRDRFCTSHGIEILKEFGDRRLAAIALRELDAGADSMLRFHAALALVATSETAADELIARLTHEHPEVRTAAAAALRQTNDQRAIEPLRHALSDSDPNVRDQAAMSLRFLETKVSVSDVDVAEATERMFEMFGRFGIKLP